MTRAVRLRWLFLLGLVVALEAACLAGLIDRFSMIPPHEMALSLATMLWSGKITDIVLQSFGRIVISLALSLVVGVVFAVAIHGNRRLRSALEPFFVTYYAIPVLAFYPMLIVIFGLGPTPQILIAMMFATIPVVVSALDGLDRVPRVLRKVAQIEGMGKIETAFYVTLPAVIPYMLTGAKLAVTYSIIGIIASEFIMSGSGVGYEVSFSYQNFDNRTMYGLILLLLIVAIGANNLLFALETRLLRRRGMK